ncbi:MAG: M28 family peptidase, partial [Candidatus Sulfotelmatobacter sp.]
MLAPFRTEGAFDIAKNREAFERYKQQWKGKLKGKIVLITELRQPKPSEQPLFRRYTDAELAELAKSPEPAIKRNIPVDQLKMPDNPEEANKYFASLPNSVVDQLMDQYFALSHEEGRFFREEGALAVIRGDNRAHNGLIFAEQAGSEKSSDPLAAPTFIVTQEQYSRMVRLLEKKQPVSLRFELKAQASDRDVDGLNIVGEIPGQKKPDEVVMIGAHFDSWHSGTGATDNGAGSAVMLEVMRILKTLDL